MYGINAFSYHWSGCIFIMCYTHLKLALLLHKTVLVNFPIGTTVDHETMDSKSNIRSSTLPRKAAVLLDIRINEHNETWKCDLMQVAKRRLALPCPALQWW